MNQRIVITGGNGFIGSSLVQYLLLEGFSDILVVDRHVNPELEVEQVQGDFGEKIFMESILRMNDVVCHFACSTIPSTSEADMASDVVENVAGTINLLEACVKAEVCRIIYLSSGGTVYGANNLARPFSEADGAEPISAHGIMKLTIEKYIKHYQVTRGLEYCIIRASNPYGRKITTLRPQGIVDVALYKAMNGEELELWGDGTIIRDFFYVNDLVRLLRLVIESPVVNTVINAGSGESLSVNHVLDVVAKVTGKNLKVNRLPSRGFDVAFNVLNISLAKQLYGWQPEINIEKGLRKILDKYYENPLRDN